MKARKSDRPILVTGAAGKTGRAVIRHLAARGAPVRALVRRPEQRRHLEELGARQTVCGDLRSRQTMADATRGAGAIYHICPNVHPDEIGIGRRVLSAARDAGVRRFVFHSVLHPQIEAMPHHWAKMRVEEVIFESGLEATILQPAPYMQNVLGQWQSVRERGLYAVPYDLDSPLVMVDLEDVAAVAALVLDEAGHCGATYELCGPAAPSARQIAAVLGRALGREVRPRAVPPREWANAARRDGLDEARIATLLAMFSYYDSQGMAGSSRVLDWLLGRPSTSFEEFAARQASAG